MTWVRFDRQTQSYQSKTRCLGYWEMPQVPQPGDGVNVNGEPYYVIRVGWAISTEEPDIHAYVTVLPASPG